MSGADQELQFHLATDASKISVGGILFQILGGTPGIPVTPKDKQNERIIMLLARCGVEEGGKVGGRRLMCRREGAMGRRLLK
jgi:hypothetical protein